MKGMKMSSIKFDKVGCVLRSKDAKDGPLTVEDAKALLGWQTEREDGPKKGWGTDYLFKDLNGDKIRLSNNQTNRPFRMTLAQRYATEMLRKKWALNGETIVVDRKGKVQSGQHRLVALVLAEQTRAKAVEHWREAYGWRGSVSIEALMVTGINDQPATVDTLDIGQKRSLGDVVFRNDTFKEANDRDAKRLSNMLAGATRLCWLRSGGKTVSDAPHFPHSEALDFIQDHPRLVKAVEFIFQEDGGKEKLISQFVSPAYAAGLLYLMATSGTDPDRYQAEGSEALDHSLWDKAEDFWVKLAQGVGNKSDGSPLFHLRNRLLRIDAGGAIGRDEIIGTVIKAFNLFADGKKAKSAKDVTIKKSRNDDNKIVLGEEPRLGGLDVEIEIIPDEPEEDQEAPEEAPAKPAKGKKGSKSKKDTEAPETLEDGTKVKVTDEDGEWEGTIEETLLLGTGGIAYNVKDGDGEIYEVDDGTVTSLK